MCIFVIYLFKDSEIKYIYYCKICILSSYDISCTKYYIKHTIIVPTRMINMYTTHTNMEKNIRMEPNISIDRYKCTRQNIIARVSKSIQLTGLKITVNMCIRTNLIAEIIYYYQHNMYVFKRIRKWNELDYV